MDPLLLAVAAGLLICGLLAAAAAIAAIVIATRDKTKKQTQATKPPGTTPAGGGGGGGGGGDNGTAGSQDCSGAYVTTSGPCMIGQAAVTCGLGAKRTVTYTRRAGFDACKATYTESVACSGLSACLTTPANADAGGTAAGCSLAHELTEGPCMIDGVPVSCGRAAKRERTHTRRAGFDACKPTWTERVACELGECVQPEVERETMPQKCWTRYIDDPANPRYTACDEPCGSAGKQSISQVYDEKMHGADADCNMRVTYTRPCNRDVKCIAWTDYNTTECIFPDGKATLNTTESTTYDRSKYQDPAGRPPLTRECTPEEARQRPVLKTCGGSARDHSPADDSGCGSVKSRLDAHLCCPAACKLNNRTWNGHWNDGTDKCGCCP